MRQDCHFSRFWLTKLHRTLHKVRKQLRALSGRSSCLPASRSRPTRARPRLGDCTTAPRRTRCGPRCRRPSTTPTTSAAAEAPDAAFARKKLAELRAKSHSDAKPAAAPAATAAADADADADAAGPSEEDMLARRLLAQVLPQTCCMWTRRHHHSGADIRLQTGRV